MNLVDFSNRWVYKGSVTTPPCAEYVYWNVLSTIYPISKEHLDLFRAQLARAADVKLDETGNWREIQETKDHDVRYVFNSHSDTAVEGLLIAHFTLTAVLVALFVAGCIYFYLKQRE